MRFALIAVVMAVAGYFAFQQTKAKPAALAGTPAASPAAGAAAPAAPVLKVEPAPVISAAEQAKIVKSTSDQDPRVRWEAMVFLDKIQSPQSYPILFEHLRKDLEPEIRVKVLKLLSERSGTDVVQNVVWACKDQIPEVRVAALQAIDKIGDFRAANAVTEAARDYDDAVRLQALKTLNSLQDKKQAEARAAAERKAAEAAAAAQKR